MKDLVLVLGDQLSPGLPGLRQLQPGDADIGRGIAMRWCAACHVVRGSQTSGGDVGPTFEQIAGKGQGLDWLDAFLADPHPPMPDMSLTRQEIRDLRAYVESLRAAR